MRCRFTLLDQLDPVPFHLDRHPTVQQVDRDDNPAASVFRSYHDALHSGERSPSDADGLTSPETGQGMSEISEATKARRERISLSSTGIGVLPAPMICATR